MLNYEAENVNDAVMIEVYELYNFTIETKHKKALGYLKATVLDRGKSVSKKLKSVIYCVLIATQKSTIDLKMKNEFAEVAKPDLPSGKPQT